MSSSLQLDTSDGFEKPSAGELYFAYGSNMYLPQMAARCPGSTLFARGILHNYKWQTNTRGGGNVVPAAPGTFVEGIIFFIPPSDLEALRGFEGVQSGNFDECKVHVEVEPLSSPAFQGKTPAEVAEMLLQPGPNLMKNELDCHPGNTMAAAEATPKEEKFLEATVYISHKYQISGPIRDEYVTRMHLAMGHARLLGISKKFLEESLYPQIFGRNRLD